VEVERDIDWKQVLAYSTGSVDQELLLRNEYVITENRILRQQIPGRVRLGDEERKTLAEIGKKLGKQALDEVATIVKPETILVWHRRLVSKKFDGSKQHKAPGRAPTAGDARVQSPICVTVRRGEQSLARHPALWSSSESLHRVSAHAPPAGPHSRGHESRAGDRLAVE
jgi:hypothetical protein